MKKCPFCGAELNDDSLFCTECGKELPKGIVCPHCGASVNEGDVFCTECGKRVDEVPQATSSEPSNPKCPHCGASINEGDVFCMECGKKIDEPQHTETVEVDTTKERVEEVPAEIVETPQTEEEANDFNYSYVEEEPKTWRDYKPPIFGGIFIVLFLGACWWFYDSSNQRAAREKAIADSLEVVRQDSIHKADSLKNVELQEAEKKKREEEAEQFCKQFSIESLLDLLAHYDEPKYAEKHGLSLVYKDVEDDGEIECTEIVYGKNIEKTDKIEMGYNIHGKTEHSCFFQYYTDTSTSASMNFSNKDDAVSFFEKAKEYGLIEWDGTHFFPKKRLPHGGIVHVDSLSWEGDYAPSYIIHQPEFEKGFYQLSIGVDF